MSSSQSSASERRIISRSLNSLESASPAWQQAFAKAIADPAELLRRLRLDPGNLPQAADSGNDFPMRVTEHYLSLIEPGRPDDPLLRQVLPLGIEAESRPGFVADPVGDREANRGHGVLHKYHGRALIVTTGACAIHCRYCFRRHFPYQAEGLTHAQWAQVLGELRSIPDLGEVILSGGDPLALSDKRLAEMIADVDRLPGLRRIRIHTRLPVAAPERITPELVTALAATRAAVAFVIHANHPREVVPSLGKALRPLTEAGVTLLNQSVLLAGVNDDADTLAELSETLFDGGILPYYLHLLDRVAGAHHFQIEPETARRLHRQLRARLPGYLVPRLVREQAGAPSKVPL